MWALVGKAETKIRKKRKRIGTRIRQAHVIELSGKGYFEKECVMMRVRIIRRGKFFVRKKWDNLYARDYIILYNFGTSEYVIFGWIWIEKNISN